ncbi:MAG: class I SAM-dependent methyltransferase [Burkholderiales bacterium]|nr:class I SAM-dependent methyltransferase [Burkholderiales bacterium]
MKSDFETTWRRRFEEFALEHEDDAGIAGWSESGLQARLRNFLRTWQPQKPGGVWLDAGCGAGTYARAMVAAGQQVVAVDYSLPSLQKAQQRSHEALLHLVGADVTRLPLPSNYCDGAICFGVLQALSGPEPAIRELARVVRPGGWIWVDALNANFWPNLTWRLSARFRGYDSRLRFDSPGQLARVFRRCGLRRVHITWVPILPGRFGRLQRFAESAAVRAMFATLPWLASAASHAYVVAAEK